MKEKEFAQAIWKKGEDLKLDPRIMADGAMNFICAVALTYELTEQDFDGLCGMMKKAFLKGLKNESPK